MSQRELEQMQNQDFFNVVPSCVGVVATKEVSRYDLFDLRKGVPGLQ